MSDIPARVGDLETKVGQHHQVLFGPEDCPDVGMVKQFSEIKELITKQTVYNNIMTWVGGAVGLAVIGYIMSVVLR
jgi:hypothetical protein